MFVIPPLAMVAIVIGTAALMFGLGFVAGRSR